MATMPDTNELSHGLADVSFGSGRLEDPFSGTKSPVDDCLSVISAPSLGRDTKSVLSTPTRTKSLSCSPDLRLRVTPEDKSLTPSQATVSPEQSLQTPRSDKVPELSSPGGTDSAASVSTQSPLREDRVGKEITDENAQGYYGPGHSVFFGNLPMSMSNNVLQQVIKKDLESRVGKCYVTIARDARNIPIAFVIFASEEDARKALAIGNQCVIGRRSLRPEAPKGNFIFIIFKNDGSEVTDNDIDRLFCDKGPILQRFTPDATMRGFFDLPKNAKCVQMGTFGDFRDARKSFHRTSDGINIMPLSKMGQTKSPGGRSTALVHRPQMADHLSLYIGNLPTRCLKEELVQIFTTVGPIKSMQLIRNPRPTGLALQHHGAAFAFVEYTEPKAVVEAIRQFDRVIFHGQELRVEFRMQTKMAVHQVQRELSGYMSQNVPHPAWVPPMDIMLAYLNARNAPPGTVMPSFLRSVPTDPIGYYVACLELTLPIH